MRWLAGSAVVVALVSVELAPRVFRHRRVAPSPPNATGQTPAPELTSIGA